MKEKPNVVAETVSVSVELVVLEKFGLGQAQRPRPRNHLTGLGQGVDVILITTPYFNPDAMVHVLLTLNEPLLQRSRPRGPLGLSLTTNKYDTYNIGRGTVCPLILEE